VRLVVVDTALVALANAFVALPVLHNLLTDESFHLFDINGIAALWKKPYVIIWLLDVPFLRYFQAVPCCNVKRVRPMRQKGNDLISILRFASHGYPPTFCRFAASASTKSRREASARQPIAPRALQYRMPGAFARDSTLRNMALPRFRVRYFGGSAFPTASSAAFFNASSSISLLDFPPLIFASRWRVDFASPTIF
jgi:hypothetical protein